MKLLWWYSTSVCLLLLLPLSIGSEVYVTAYPNGTQCPSYAVICHNLSYYFAPGEEGTALIQDNVTINFLEGTHNMPRHGMYLQNKRNITLQGITNTTTPPVLLYCSTDNYGIIIESCENVQIIGIRITTTCDHLLYMPKSIGFHILKSAKVDFVNVSIVTETNPLQTGIYLDTSRNVSLYNVDIVGEFYCVAILAIYDDSMNKADMTHLIISNTNITSSVHVLQYSRGIHVNIQQTNYTVEIKMDHLILNSIDKNIHLISNQSSLYTLIINDVTCINGEYGIYLLHVNLHVGNAHPVILINNSKFIQGVIFPFKFEHLSLIETNGSLTITSSIFADSGQVIITQTGSHFEIFLTNCTFRNNNIHGKHSLTSGDDGILYIIFIPAITIENCTFSDNYLSAIYSQSSNIHFKGINTFKINSNRNGGAIILRESYMIIDIHARLEFTDNHADLDGGAIYIIKSFTEHSKTFCFFQFYEYEIHWWPRDILIFNNNTAGNAGTAIYGSNTDRCGVFVLANLQFNFIDEISCFNQTGDSIISSNPKNVCFCNHNDTMTTKICNVTSLDNYTAYPGQLIEFSVVAVGDKNGSTIGVIQITSGDSQTKTVPLTKVMCTTVNYTILVNDPSVKRKTVHVSVLHKNTQAAVNTININVDVLQCNKGFNLSMRGICDCINQVEQIATCYPTKQIIERRDKQWIGYNDILNCTITNTNCPYEYCITDRVNITDLDNTDIQCDLNRSGQLCGGCIHGYSLVLGSDACKDCRGKNRFLSLIIPFAVAGIVLVFFLFCFNLTVSVGTINGLLFFANVMKIYEQFLMRQYIPFLSQFISWINLDFDIELCFVDKMTSLYKVGLQFVFPFYLLLIIIVIIIVSKYSQRIAKLVGNNGIPVLATLILLSYTKIIRTVIMIFSRIQVDCGKDTRVYWYVDPTQRYNSGGHTILYIIAAIITALFILPYTVFLLLYPLLELSDGGCRQKLSWFLFKFKPYFDAYRGPHTTRFCIWPGVLLLIRIILAIVVALTEDDVISITVTIAVLVILITILSNRNVYNSKALHILDICLLAVLLVFSYMVIVGKNSDKTNNVNFPYVLGTTISISIIIFLVILCYHTYKYSIIGGFLRRKIHKKDNGDTEGLLLLPADEIPAGTRMYDGGKLRESLLSDHSIQF